MKKHFRGKELYQYRLRVHNYSSSILVDVPRLGADEQVHNYEEFAEKSDVPRVVIEFVDENGSIVSEQYLFCYTQHYYEVVPESPAINRLR